MLHLLALESEGADAVAGLFFEAQLSGVQWIRGIAHVGANVGQEVGFYAKLKDVPVLLIEPLPELIPRLEAEVRLHGDRQFRIARNCCSDRDGDLAEFHVSLDPNAQASSMLPPGKAVEVYPWLANTKKIAVETITLDTLLERDHPDLDINMLAIDTQGADLKVLSGARRTLARCDGVYVEVSDEALYEGGCTFREVVDFLDGFGFGLYRSALTSAGWGNAFFKARISPALDEVEALAARNIAKGRPASASSVFRDRLTPNLTVTGNPAQPHGYRSQGTRGDEWLEIDLGDPAMVDEIILTGPASRNRLERLRVLVRAGEENWAPVYDYGEAGRILSRFDRLPVGRQVSAVRVESKAEALMLAQVMVIAA